jgi:hypothetical protein
MIRYLLLITSIFYLSGCISNEEPCFPGRKEFNDPPVSDYPRPLWFWNNTKVTSEGIDSQMRQFYDSCGYGGFGILPFGTEFGPEYLSEEYFEVYGKALSIAAELGLTMWLYDEFGFPSGGAGPHNGDGKGRFAERYPGQTIKRLDKHEMKISGPAVIQRKVPDGETMAVVAMESSSLERVSLSVNIADGVLHWKVPPGEWQLMFFSCVDDGDPIVDYLDAEAVRNFIRMTHDEYYNRFSDYFGNVIAGTFFDEPTMYRAGGRMWTGSFNQRFREKYDFDPEPWYPALWYDIGPETRAARNYLFGFRTELYTEGFTKEVNDWSVAHNIIATGHQDQEEVLNPVSVSGDLMKCFKYLEIPGIDKIGGDRPAERFYKLISSAAYNYDRALVMSETYGAMGNIGWDEIFSVAMDQYAKGINVLIPHAVWYDDSRVTFLPELSHRNPLYADSLMVFNRFLSRLNTILQKPGRHIADLAILYPIHNLQAGHYFDGPLGYYRGGVEIPETDYIDVANWLTEDAGKDFTFIHPEILDEKCTVSEGKLHLQNSLNRGDFSVMIVPSCHTISLSNLYRIREFYEKGGNVIFTTRLPEFSAEPGRDSEVADIMRIIFPHNGITTKYASKSGGNGQALFIPEPGGKILREALDSLLISFDVEYPECRDLRYIHKEVCGRDVYYFANTGKSDINLPVRIRHSGKYELWDPHNGRITPAKRHKDDESVWQLSLGPLQSVFMVSVNKIK